jgi:hypothetical protein
MRRLTTKQVVKNRAHTTDAEAEYQAFYIETGMRSQIKQARRRPVFRYKQRLTQANGMVNRLAHIIARRCTGNTP